MDKVLIFLAEKLLLDEAPVNLVVLKADFDLLCVVLLDIGGKSGLGEWLMSSKARVMSLPSYFSKMLRPPGCLLRNSVMS